MATSSSVLHRAFKVEEIERSKFLQAMYWILLIGFVLAFREWMTNVQIDRQAFVSGEFVCPSYFRDCGLFYVLDALPRGSGIETLFAVLFGLLTASALLAWSRRWDWALALLLPLVAFKLFYLYVLNYRSVVEYEYFHLPEVLVFVFAARKEFFLRAVLVLTYLFAATMKFNEAWIVGGYFSALQNGLPWFPDSWIPFLTNAVVLFEIFAPWALLSADRRLRWTSLGLWIAFHFYSLTLVGFNYPAYCIPLLLALFIPDPSPQARRVRFAREEWAGGLVMLLISVVSMVPWWVPGNREYSLQGRRFGVQMFDANHQCLSQETMISPSGESSTRISASNGAQRRCGPYLKLFSLQEACRRQPGLRIEWLFLGSVNGNPFYEIVNVPDACALSYSEFGLNEWMKFPETGAPVRGYPEKNFVLMDSPAMGWKIVKPEPDPTQRSEGQAFLQRHLDLLRSLYWALWGLTVLFFAARAWRQRAQARTEI